MLTWSLTIALGAAIIATATLSGIFGMAGGIVLMGIFLLFLPVGSAMMLHGATQAVSNGYRAFLTREHIDWGIFLRYTLGTLGALAILSAISFVPEKAWLFVAVGSIPFIAASLPKRLSLDITRPGVPFIAGFFISAVNIVAGVAGPLLDVFFVRSHLTRYQIVATKAVTQTFSHLMKLVYFGVLVREAAMAANGDLSVLPWWLYLMVIPCAMLGTAIGTKILNKISETNFRRWSQWIVLTLGGICIARGLSLLLG